MKDTVARWHCIYMRLLLMQQTFISVHLAAHTSSCYATLWNCLWLNRSAYDAIDGPGDLSENDMANTSHQAVSDGRSSKNPPS